MPNCLTRRMLYGRQALSREVVILLKYELFMARSRESSQALGNPEQDERDSGMIPNGFRGDLEQDSGMEANTGSAMKPNSFMPIPEQRSASPE